MYKMLVVDDEPISVQSIVYMIEKNFDNVKVVGTCNSGKSAIEKALVENPDVIIMDIQMQGINGLKAVKQIKENNQNISFIILSAYDEFDYATEAMGLGVEEYLLKPVKEANFVQALTDVFNKYTKKVELRKQLLEQQERIEMVIPILETGFIYNICMFGEGKKELKNYCRILERENTAGYVIVVEFGEKIGAKTENKIGAGIKGEKWHSEFKRIMKSFCDCIVGPIMLNQMLIYVFNDQSRDSYEQKSKSLEIAQSFLKRAAKYYQDICIGIGNQYDDVSSANSSYQEALRALKYISMNNQDNDEGVLIIHVDDIIEDEVITEYKWEELVEEIYEQVEYRDGSSVHELFNQYFTSVAASNNIKIIKNQMIGLVVGLGNRWNIILPESSEVLNEIVQAESLDSLRQLMKNFLMHVLQQVNIDRKARVNTIIEKADQFIEQHYAEQISLNDIAKEVNLSTYYFSRFYKEETGMNYSEKLLNVRIEKAKELLKQTDIPVKNVSHMVGYLEPTYFSKIFKKMTGHTAGEYKKII